VLARRGWGLAAGRTKRSRWAGPAGQQRLSRGSARARARGRRRARASGRLASLSPASPASAPAGAAGGGAGGGGGSGGGGAGGGMAAPPNVPPTNVPPANAPPANPPPVLALVPMPPAPQNQVKNGFHTKTWGDGSKCVAQPARPLPPACVRAPPRVRARAGGACGQLST